MQDRESQPKVHSPEKILLWCMWYFENQRLDETIAFVLDNDDAPYIEEKVRRYKHDFAGFIAWLDQESLAKF